MKASLDDILSFLVSGRGRTPVFYPVIINNFTKVPSPGIGTMGVTLTPEGGQILKYDPELLERLHFDGLKIILIHEVYHIVLKHLPRLLRRLAQTPEDQKYKVFVSSNLAADYAVNSLLVKTRECTLKDLKEGMGEYAGVYPSDMGLPEGKSYEWYVTALMDLMDDPEPLIIKGIISDDGGGISINVPVPQRGSGNRTPEESEEGQSGEEPDKDKNKTYTSVVEAIADYHKKGSPTSNHEELLEAVDNMTGDELSGHADKVDRKNKKSVAKAVESSNSKSRGTLPGSLQSLLKEFLAPPTIPWERVLRTWLTNTRKTRSKRTMARPRRRLLGQRGGCIFPGSVRDPRYHILFAIDTSGSMSEKDLQSALGELRGVQKASEGVKITVLECDTRIHKEYVLGPTGEIQFNIRGRGGTLFDPVFVRSRDIKPDCILFITDGYAPLPDPSNRVKTPLLWVLTTGGCIPGSSSYRSSSKTSCEYGRVLWMEK